MNVAISFGHVNKDDSIWNNDSKQNSLNLYLLLKKIHGINVYLINFGNHVNILTKESRKELSGIKLYNWLMIKDKIKFDVFIECGLKLNKNTIDELKNKNIKYIFFNDYNKYLMDVEDILFNKNNNEILYDEYDEIWLLQSYQKMNKYYLEEIYKSKIFILPNIWSKYFINNEIKRLNKDNKKFHYDINKSKKNIVIFQKNDNVNNTFIYPLLIVEKLYNKKKVLFDKIDKIILLNSKHLLSNKKFMSIINKLNIYKDNLILFENSKNMIDIIQESTDIIISHQWDNTIDNYFFNLLYGNYPILHNSDVFKFNNYYYSDFNINLAIDKLEHIILNHDRLYINYNNKVQGMLNNYDINNKNIQNEYYKRLLELKKK